MRHHDPDRQRGRAFQLQQLGAAAARADYERREKLQRRVQRRALEFKVLSEAIAIERELEAKRCKLCDMLRAEAYGLCHANWMERRCGRCWMQQAEELAMQRHNRASNGAARQLSPPKADQRADGPDEGTQTQGGAASGLSAILEDIPVDRIDDAIEALRARDVDRLMQLLDARALARHFGLGADGTPSLQQEQRQQQPRVPPPEQPYGSYYYHDAVIQSLGDAGPAPAQGSLVTAPGCEGDGARSPSHGAEEVGHARRHHASEAPDVGTASHAHENAADGERQSQRSTAARQPQQSSQPNKEQHPVVSVPAATALGESDASSEVSFAPAASGHGGGRQSAVTAPGKSVKSPGSAAAGYQPEPRPLPSKPRALPSGEAELEAALRGAEQLVVFGRNQRQRSEALFYSHQLRTALADLRLLNRKARKAEAVHQHGVRLDTRDEYGELRIIREDRSEQAPSPNFLRRFEQPDSLYVDPPKRTPRWLEHIHPDRPDPAKAADPVAWKPPSAKVPPPRHTAGIESAGDWSEYRYDWDLACIRSMPVNDYKTVLRNEAEYRHACATLQAQAHVLSGLQPQGEKQPPAARAASADARL